MDHLDHRFYGIDRENVEVQQGRERCDWDRLQRLQSVGGIASAAHNESCRDAHTARLQQERYTLSRRGEREQIGAHGRHINAVYVLRCSESEVDDLTIRCVR